jgi:hypothetical protein
MPPVSKAVEARVAVQNLLGHSIGDMLERHRDVQSTEENRKEAMPGKQQEIRALAARDRGV